MECLSAPTDTKAWVFVRGSESVRIVIDGTSVGVYGPGDRFSHSRFGESMDATLHQAAVEQTLRGAGVEESAVTALVQIGADEALIESAVSVAQTTASPPLTQADDDRARSAAERFLFNFLESLPETAGRFQLNASLDFQFGRRPAEVDQGLVPVAGREGDGPRLDPGKEGAVELVGVCVRGQGVAEVSTLEVMQRGGGPLRVADAGGRQEDGRDESGAGGAVGA